MFLSRSLVQQGSRRRIIHGAAMSLSSFSKESVTTKVSPSVNHGPFGSGGTISGFSKYDGVRAAFEENFARKLELGSQLVIYEKGEKVVDLFGAAPEQEGYNANTLQCVYSSGKNMEAIAMAMLVDRGLVDYDDPVTMYWPEFGANGKDRVTLADVMRHEGGVPFLVDPKSPSDSKDTIVITPEDVANVDALEMKICAAADSPAGDNPRMYHSITRGWLVNGILRRVDPGGRSLGTFIREEIAKPLDITYICGIPKEEQGDYEYANMSQGSILYNLCMQILPAMSGFGDVQLASLLKVLLKKDNLISKQVVSWLKLPPTPGFNDTQEGRSLEISSAGMFTNARSMAKINAVMAGDGSFGGVRLLSEEGVRNSMSAIKPAVDLALETPIGFSKGGFGRFSDSFGDADRPVTPPIYHADDRIAFGDFIGWGGWGGSISFWDRDREIAFSYCMNAMEPFVIGGPRTRRILLELQKVI